ncbi:MAG: hypothetical protein IKE22_07540 [Atopobiaceae bacterium]|nr:hypothetical protein [Atopobiaceae bacterium]
MSESSIQQVSPNNTALNAEHYQSFEMAKANDGILGGDNIAQIRKYAAFARTQAQVVHKDIATLSEIDDVTAAKAEMTETAQTFAKVGIYADQRIGEILRELPKAKAGRKANSSTAVEEKTKADAINEAGIKTPTAYQLEKMAANPDVVEAVIAKAEQDGRVVSRSQVLKAIKERDEARKDAEEVSELYGKTVVQRDQAESERKRMERELRNASITQTNLEMEAESLRQQLAAKPEPEVIEREVEVVREVVPEETRKTIRELERSNKQFSEDYEDLRRRFSNTQAELKQARSELATNEAALSSIREIQALTRAMGEFVGRYSGHAWPFADVDEQTMGEFARTLGSLSAFVDALKNDIHTKEEN